MAKRAMAGWKVAAMVLLVIAPGGSLVLLAIALRRAWKRRSGPFAWFYKRPGHVPVPTSSLLQLAANRA